MPYYYYGCVGNITYVIVEKQLLLWLCREHNICHSRKTAELMFERQFLITSLYTLTAVFL
jgi:hypothetical protein